MYRPPERQWAPAAAPRPRRSAADQAQIPSILPDPGDGRCTARVELAAECSGCGVITELEQGTRYCFACTYQGWPT
ncbi:MAG TPA: hypothetical protein VGJ54_07145 [Streptosporangiaceae bacterium]